MPAELFDTHAHLYDKQFTGELENVFQRMAAASVTRVMCIAFDLASSEVSASMAEERDGVWASAGVHPHVAAGVSPDYLIRLADLARRSKVVALGEIGLDYYRDLSPRPVQQKVFREQLALVRELAMPVIIHVRDAYGDLLDILRRDGVSPAGGIVHCFSGSWEVAKECIKMGFYISLAGPVTYKNASKLKDVAVKVPVERLLVETDSPYLAPEPLRGRRNEPAYVRYVLVHIAALRHMTAEELTGITTANAIKVFNLA